MLHYTLHMDKQTKYLNSLVDKALETLDMAMSHPDKKIAIAAAKQILDEHTNRENSALRKDALANSAAIMPPRFMAALLGGLARLGGLQVETDTLESMASDLTDKELNAAIPSEDFTVLSDDEEAEEEPGEVHIATLPQLSYLQAAETPEHIIANQKRLRS